VNIPGVARMVGLIPPAYNQSRVDCLRVFHTFMPLTGTCRVRSSECGITPPVKDQNPSISGPGQPGALAALIAPGTLPGPEQPRAWRRRGADRAAPSW